MLKVHLDTDLGGDSDDLCALAMLLKWPNVQITGITTNNALHHRWLHLESIKRPYTFQTNLMF